MTTTSRPELPRDGAGHKHLCHLLIDKLINDLIFLVEAGDAALHP
jgi:hypothetical protein